MNPFFKDLMRFESSGSNVTNERESTSSGRARGFFQVTDGTWRDFGRKAGIDFSKYPTALSAPYSVQLAVAKLIPFKRWDPITRRRMSAAGHTFDENKTLGEIMAAKGETGAEGETGAPRPAAAAVVTGAGQSTGNYASPKEPVPGATQPNFVPSVADAGTDDAKPSLASAFADALGGASMGGTPGGGSSGGSLSGSELTPAPDLRTKSGVDAGALTQDWDALQTQPLGKLADLFALPTIGPQIKKPGVNVDLESWI